MNMKSFMPILSMVTTATASVILIVVSFITAVWYGATFPNANNPFIYVNCYFLVSFWVQLFNEEFLGNRDEFVSKLILSPLKLITVVLICMIWRSEGHVFFTTLLTGAVLWLSYSGVVGMLSTVASLRKKITERRYFANEMKEVAETARTEQTVVADLNDFLMSVYPQGEEKENG